MDQQLEQMINIFLPHYAECKKRVLDNNLRLVHYTNAEAAMNIIQSKEFWLKKNTLMNDYSETYHGFELLKQSYEKQKKSLSKIFDNIFPDFVEEVESLFNSLWQKIQYNAYIACFSEHEEKEDILGRLSMWRAYGRKNGVALVLNNKPFFGESNAFKAITTPVLYKDKVLFDEYFTNIVGNLSSNIEFISKQNRDLVKAFLFNTFLILSISVKHPGFEEEKEWRVIYTGIEESKYLKNEVKCLNGTPQLIHKIPLKDIPKENVNGIEIPELIERIIIGPSDNAAETIEAFQILLEQAKVKEPHTKVFFSDIPLRN